MRTPPHLPARPGREHRDTEHPRRHPYVLHELPARHDLAAHDASDPFAEQRLLGIRELSNQAIGSIDDLLQHTA
ncbi:hypothetical protein [Nonomuraea aridisoli]|uniref:Uncharacterized protein n=1 Tax=Nonomuraea aridisoli TaxID=2070368 RepID=A0A2W2DVA0_9ACTN|nr:hypothetical protein [Nonomuraea aridisoli]PZG15762.1 hypothetical protein C1J01_23150 [Nonomuraea aridisoli]